MSVTHVHHPLWQTSLDLVFDCYLGLGCQPSGNPILERLRRTTRAYVRTLEVALSSDYAALRTARNLLVQLRNNLVLAKDLGLLETVLYSRLKKHLLHLAPLYKGLAR